MRDIKDLTILILPGVGGSGAGHWQTSWEKAFPGFQRVEQALGSAAQLGIWPFGLLWFGQFVASL